MRKSLSIISFNVFGVPFNGSKILKTFLRTRIRKRFAIIGRKLNDSGVDFLTLQEIYTFPHLSILKKHLTNYPYCYYKKFIYGPRGGIVTFSKTPMEEVEYRDFKNKGSFMNSSIVGKISKRGILITKVTNKPFYIVNTHLTQNSDENFKESNRYFSLLTSQLQDIVLLITLLRKNNTVLLAGDFNLPKNINLYQKFLNEVKMRDLFSNTFLPTKHEEFLFAKEYLECIDYIFISNNIKIKKLNTSFLFTEKMEITPRLNSYLSDHIGLRAELEFEEEGKTITSN